MKQKKVLFLSEEVPFSRNCGQRVRIYNVLRCLAELYELTCVFPCRKEDMESVETGLDIKCRKYFIGVSVKKGAVSRRLEILRRKLHLDRDVRENLETIMQEVKPDVVWLEYSYLGHYIHFFKRAGIPTVYVSHNAQAYLDYVGWKSEEGLKRKVLTLPVILLNYLHERLFFPEADRFLCISEVDMKYYSSFVSRQRIGLLPNFYIETDIEEVREFRPSHDYICMVGSMNSFQNYRGAVLLLKDIWPLIKERIKDLHLYLIGKLPPEGTDKYTELKSLTDGLPDVHLTGEVEHVVPYIKGAVVSLVPILHGSGTRTKIIESVACRTPVVSTTLGAEGLPFSDGKSIMIADDPRLFAEKTEALLADGSLRERISAEAFRIFEEELGYEVNRERIRCIVDDLASTCSRR